MNSKTTIKKIKKKVYHYAQTIRNQTTYLVEPIPLKRLSESLNHLKRIRLSADKNSSRMI